MNEKATNNFMCYFCNKLITNDTRTGHSSVCANILTGCPNKCGAYVCRKDLQHHQNECVNRPSRSQYEQKYNNTPQNYPNTASLDRRQPMPQENFNEAMLAMQRNIQSLTNQIYSHERRQNTALPNVDTLRPDLEKLKYQSEIVNEWKKAIDFKLETLKDTLLTFERTKNEQEIHLMSIKQKLQLLDKLQLDMNIHIDTFVKEHNYNEDNFFNFSKRIDELKDIFTQDNATLGVLLDDQRNTLANFHAEFNELKQIVNEQKAKLSSVSFEVKSVTHTASTAEQKIEIQEREFVEMKKQLEQLQFDFEIIESLASGQLGLGAPITSPGHIVWRIPDFDEKLAKAKENNTVVKSQTFYSHDFGYKLRALCYLNGLRKWKDRYALIALHIFKGEFDPLLKWPCHVEGTVTLRDLENSKKPNNFSKYISAKREEGDEENDEPQESSSSYIFIPHTTLLKSTYLKDNCVYFDIRIDQSRQLTETTL